MLGRKNLAGLVCVGVGLLALWARGAEGPITTESLLRQMTDLTGMAEFPAPGYTCKQFSSWDRGSTSPADQSERNWFANGDCGHYLRVEDKAGRKEYVMADMAGPGAIVRIWSANPKGIIRIYIDGSETPAIECKMDELMGGKYPGLPKPIACEVSKGWNLYFPIPYAKSCKVTGEGVAEKHRLYYHVNYRTYPAGTNVASFKPEQIRSLEEPIKAVAATLAAPRRQEKVSTRFEVSATAGAQSSSSVTSNSPSAITSLVLQVSAEDREAALRGVVMKITFDGQQTVEAPVGDFFGSAPGINAYASLPLGMTADGEMWCQWVMPFKGSARFEFVNHTSKPVSITGRVETTPYQWTDATLYFHAKWRSQFDVPTRPMIDWNYLTATGKGVFAGVAFAIDNPVKDWWGEGDEKIYVDGEKFPSHFGTGTEDYYGYAWCWPGLFVHAYHNQTRCDGPGNFGRTSVNRWHILDRIPFEKDFKFDMELWHWNKSVKVNMAVISYWYAQAGAQDTFKPIEAADVVLRPAPELKVNKVAGAIEGERMRIIAKTGNPAPQNWDGLSEGRQLWWHNTPKVGDELVLGFNAPKAGKYRVFGRFLKAVDYGIVQMAINGATAGAPVDFYNDGVVAMEEMDLGVFELKAGENRFSARITGANAKAVKSYMFGLDYLRLQAVE